MGSQDSAGKPVAESKLFSYGDLFERRTPFDWVRHWTEFHYFEGEGFAELVKAISKGDSATEDQIFRLWGIRR